MSAETYLKGIAALVGLARQTDSAFDAARADLAAREADTGLRHGDLVVADGRDQVVAALQHSRESLQAMGLTELPRQVPLDVDPAVDALLGTDAALRLLGTLAARATEISVEQVAAVAEHRRLVAAAERAHADERRRAAEAEKRARELAEEQAREQAERDARERAERDRVAGRRSELQMRARELRAQRAGLERQWWRLGRRGRLGALDTEIAQLDEQARLL